MLLLEFGSGGEMAYAEHSKCSGLRPMWVRVPPRASSAMATSYENGGTLAKSAPPLHFVPELCRNQKNETQPASPAARNGTTLRAGSGVLACSAASFATPSSIIFASTIA